MRESARAPKFGDGSAAATLIEFAIFPKDRIGLYAGAMVRLCLRADTSRHHAYLSGKCEPVCDGMKRILPWLACAAFLLLRWSCRVRVHNDPRSGLRRAGRNYVFAVMHAHQVAALLVSEPQSGVMVSRSADGGIMVPAIRLSGCVPVRGSGGEARKGGSRAMHQMIRHVRGGRSAALTVDGPLGPRGRVHPGIVMLAEKTGACIIPVSVLPTRRIVLKKSWDRFQMPLPGATIDVRFGPPLALRPGESLEVASERLERHLETLDRRWDPDQIEPAGGDVGHPVRERLPTRDTRRSRCA